ncbi:MAG TPA: chlorite dismutase family protein [Polyangiaceae bacterium]|nr:chlorite dismutase family protein [Polyangiaceae bacterium]
MTSHPTHHQEATKVDVCEHGNDAEGRPISLDRRLFMQLVAFECRDELPAPHAKEALATALEASGLGGALYEDINHPRGFALLTFSEQPLDFVDKLRPALAYNCPASLAVRPEFGMLGRTYSTGFEQNLAFWLLERPKKTVTNPAWPFAVWYPLRRKGGFDRMDPKEKGGIMREHGGIGRAYGEADLAHDVRLACHGLDQNDNDFVIGLIGASLHPLSHVVQAMRQTRQTAEFMEKMGPFFVGRAVVQKPGPQ